MRRAAAAICLFVCLHAPAQSAKTEAQLDAEATQANTLYSSMKVLDSLPLYEDLHAQRPKNLVYTERLAMAYFAKSGAAASEPDHLAARKRAEELVAEAKAGGDSSDLLQIIVEQLAAPRQDAPKGPLAPGRETFNQAEQLFNKGDMAAALALYQKSWEENPKFYYAPLYAGDSAYKLNKYDEAGTWYARAIAIDPDTETAHRYWADVLTRSGKQQEARRQYILAYLCNPYTKATRIGLREWADANHYRIVPPPVTLPAAPTTGKDGHINITINPGKQGDALAPAWLMYSMNAALWQGEKFKKQFPNEKTYRHSLAEEVDSLRLVLTMVKEQKIPDSRLDPSLKTLIALDKDNMLECWILIDNPDQGVAQDYLAYRATHRDLLQAYVEKYDLHPA